MNRIVKQFEKSFQTLENKKHAKPRGKKAKQRASKRKAIRSVNVDNMFKELRSNSPESLRIKKKVSRSMALVTKYWHINMRLRLKRYKPFYRYKRGRNISFLAIKKVEMVHVESIRRLQRWSCNWRF